jgi:hypothetical protein
MSGRQHHYLPQLIQRPFAYRQRGKEFYVHAHHRTRGVFTPNTRGLGKELDFYGGPDNTSLDDAITRGEGDLAATLQAVNEGVEVPPIDIAMLICALAFRTKSMREALIGLFPALLSALRGRLLDITRLREGLILSLNSPAKRKRLIYEQIDRRFGPLPREQRAKVYGALLPKWKTHVAEQLETLVADARQMADTMLAKARAEADKIADEAYLAALAKDPVMSVRAKRMANEMVFEVLDAPSGESFILGDCGPVAVFSDGKPRLVLAAFDSDAVMDLVFLPSSPARCIVGRLPAVTTSIGVADINRICAGLSLEFFICNRDGGDDIEELRASIGSLNPIDNEEDIIRLLSSQSE